MANDETNETSDGDLESQIVIPKPELPNEIEMAIWRAVLFARELGTTALTLTSKAGTAVLVFVPAPQPDEPQGGQAT